MIYLAIRYLLERRRQTFLTFLGVFFGATAYVAVSGFFLGFQGFIIDQLVNNAAQIHIQARQDYLQEHQLDSNFFGTDVRYVFWPVPPSGVSGFQEVQNPQSWYDRLRADPRVEAFSPLMTAPALFTMAKISASASLVGCDPLQQAKVTSVADYMVEGKFSDLAKGGNRIVLGDELMKKLGARVNQTILVSVGSRGGLPFKVAGRYMTGNRVADMIAYGTLHDVQRLNRTPNVVNEIGVRLKDYTQAAAIARQWSSIAPERTESWDQLNANIFSVFRIQTTLRFAMILTVLVVAGFGMYNILSMTVHQKRQDIAILHSMGYDTFDIVTLFFSQGLVIGFCGTISGLVVGYLLCLYLQTIPFMPVSQSNPAGHLQISLSLSIYIQAALLTNVSVSLASIWPARAAGSITPIEIIRSGG